MDSSIISTAAGLIGAIIGGLTSFMTSWVTQNVQARNQRLVAENARRQELYGAFMDELATLYASALRAETVNYGDLVKVFALRGRITLMASAPVVDAADGAMKFVVDLYLGPPRDAREMRAMMDQSSADAIGAFARTCREEMQAMGLV
jgi:hypothetical protein